MCEIWGNMNQIFLQSQKKLRKISSVKRNFKNIFNHRLILGRNQNSSLKCTLLATPTNPFKNKIQNGNFFVENVSNKTYGSA